MQHALGDALSERGRMSEAETAYRNALSVRESALTYNNLGNLYAATGRFKGATTAYQKAVEIEPDYIEAYMNKGLAAMQAEQITDAHSAFERAAILDPTNAEIFYNLGVIREKLGRPDQATTAYAHAIHCAQIGLKRILTWEKPIGTTAKKPQPYRRTRAL